MIDDSDDDSDEDDYDDYDDHDDDDDGDDDDDDDDDNNDDHDETKATGTLISIEARICLLTPCQATPGPINPRGFFPQTSPSPTPSSIKCTESAPFILKLPCKFYNNYWGLGFLAFEKKYGNSTHKNLTKILQVNFHISRENLTFPQNRLPRCNCWSRST